MHETVTWVALAAAFIVAQVQVATGDGSCSGITRGRHFVLAFTGNHVSNYDVIELSLIVVAFSDQLTTVTISSRYLINQLPYEKSFEIEARGSLRATLPSELLLGTSSERSNRVIAVDADSDVSIYGLNYAPFTTDAFLGIPVDNLGVSHVAMSYQNDGDNDDSSLFAIVGVEDDTSVSIVLTAGVTLDGVSYQGGDTLEININKYEVLQLVADSNAEYIGGSTIESDNPIAVFTGHLCASTPGSACDTLSEQLVPVESWGTQYIYTATGTPNDRSVYTIHVHYSDTVVSVPTVGEITLQTGQFWQGELVGSGIIKSNKPISVLQLLRTINQVIVDPSIIQVPAEDQYSFIFGFSTPYSSGGDEDGFFNFLNIVVKANESSTILMNGEIILTDDTVAHHKIPQTDYVVYTLEIPKGEGTYYVEQSSLNNTSAFTVIVYGYEDDETYGYSAGLFLPTDERLLNIEPYFVREVGGEQLALTLPCLEENVAETHSIKCRFTTSTEATEEVAGTPIDLYNYVCITPVFHLISYVTVDVSVDDGRTFLFRGNIHVLPQHVLPPKVVVEQSGQTFGYINFNENGTIFINWISDYFIAVEWVDISVRVSFPNFGSPGFGWSLDIDIKQVENTGSFNLIHEHFPLNIAPFGTSVAVFIVKPRSESILYHLSSGFLKVLGSTSCNEWSDNRLANFMPDGLSNVPSCPCTDDQAFVDGNFQEDDSSDRTFIHEGAVLCFRSSVTSGSSGQQCCYGSDGNILVGPPAGGTADAYALHIGTIWHFWYDILPWLSCCKQESHLCSFYYEFRPSDDCSQYQPPRPTRGTGDPHFLSLDGKEFTFNGAGEFLLLKSTLHNLTFQARMEALPGTDASVYTAFVLSSNLSPVIQVQRSPLDDSLMILMDMVQINMFFEGHLIREQTFPGVRLAINQDLSKVRISLSTGATLLIRITPEMMSFILQLPDEFKEKTEGLLGNFNDHPEDDLMLPDGSTLSPNSTIDIIHYDFGLSWMLAVNTSIFTYLPPTDFYSFRDVNFVPTLELPNTDEVSEDIKSVCGNSTICIFDAVTTGSTSFANDSLQDVHEFETITEQSVKIVSCGFPGEVVNGYVNGSVYLVGNTVVVICNEVSFLSYGDGELHCQPNGTWSQQLPECILIRCDVPGTVENGVVNGDTYFVGSALNISCNDGFILFGQSVLTCQLNGTWSANLPTCTTVNDSTGIKVAVMIAVVVILSSLLLLTIVIIISCFLQKQRSEKKQTSDVNQQMATFDPDNHLTYSQNVYD